MSKKYVFNGITDLKEYLKSSKFKKILLLRKVNTDYVGLLNNIYLCSENSGNNLSIISEWECRGLDVYGDIGVIEVYYFKELDSLLNFVKTVLNLEVKNINLSRDKEENISSPFDSKDKVSLYQLEWKRFQKDWLKEKLFLGGIKPDKKESYGFDENN